LQSNVQLFRSRRSVQCRYAEFVPAQKLLGPASKLVALQTNRRSNAPLEMTRTQRWIALLLALAGACAFAVSVWVGAWWTVGEATIGPFGARACFDGDCRLRGLSWIGGTDLWMRSAFATGVAGVLAMFVLTAVAGATAAKRVPRLLARTTLVTIATAIACSAYFVAAFPGVGGAEAHYALGAALFPLGALLGIASSVVVIRAKA
jgi:hypothetical protein